MGTWSIMELDKSKTEQSISNELARLDICRENLDKLTQELERYKVETNNKLSKYYERIAKIQRSIDAGEEFVRECKDHLNDFENAEGN
jgi:predicted translin family RNA/ssDNA-binding protein